jgi:hypothetical protein
LLNALRWTLGKTALFELLENDEEVLEAFTEQDWMALGAIKAFDHSQMYIDAELVKRTMVELGINFLHDEAWTEPPSPRRAVPPLPPNFRVFIDG